VVEKYISGQKGYKKGLGVRERGEGSGERCSYEATGAMPVGVDRRGEGKSTQNRV